MSQPNAPRVYRQWSGSPKGTPEDPKRCIEEVADGGMSPLAHQCYKKRGHGPGGLYCVQHNPEAVAERRRKADERAAERFRQSAYGQLKGARAEKAKLVAALERLCRAGEECATQADRPRDDAGRDAAMNLRSEIGIARGLIERVK